MTKEEYLQLKNDNNWIQLSYEYWKDTKPPEYNNLSLEEFNDLFSAFIGKFNGHAISVNGMFKTINSTGIKNTVINYWDDKMQNNV